MINHWGYSSVCAGSNLL